MKLQKSIFGPALLLSAGQIAAAPVAPEQGGWSGDVEVGIAGIDVGDKRIDGLEDHARSEGFGFPLLSLDVAYTLKNTGTQFYLQYARAEPAPAIFLDLEASFGPRQKLPEVGTIDVALSGSAPVTKVWKDPYLTDATRGDNDFMTRAWACSCWAPATGSTG